jgi:GMP synthase PP-ATPase subunit
MNTVTQPTQFPEFWNEEWLKIAINELDRRKMTTHGRASFEILVARNTVAVKAESRTIKEALALKNIEANMKFLKWGNFPIEEIDEYNGITVDFITHLQKKRSN